MADLGSEENRRTRLPTTRDLVLLTVALAVCLTVLFYIFYGVFGEGVFFVPWVWWMIFGVTIFVFCWLAATSAYDRWSRRRKE